MRFFTLLLLCAGLVVQAQGFTPDKTEVTVGGNHLDFILNGTVYLTNNTNAVLPMTWVRTENDLASDWTSAVCDTEQCSAITTSTRNFPLPTSGLTNYVKVQFTTFEQEGWGNVTLLVKEQGQADSDAIELTFTAQSDVVGVEVTDKDGKLIDIYPNPANNAIYVDVNTEVSNDVQFRLTDMTGKVLRVIDGGNASFQQIQMATDDLNSGMYLLQTISEGRVLSAKKVQVMH